jgi:hypothetical protein
MKDKEKILRLNLHKAQEELDKPYDIGGMLIASVAFGIMKYRED